MWYNEGNKIVVSGGACNTPDRTHLDWRCIMDTLPHSASEGNTPKCKVYRLINKDHIPFYVGITINLYERYKQHMRCDGTNVQKDAIIQEDLQAGFLTIMDTIEQVDTLEQGLERELYWIHYYRNRGVLLTNLAGVPTDALPATAKKRGRQRPYDAVKKIILHRHIHGTWPDELSRDMKGEFEFSYFVKPKRAEKIGNPGRYAQHVKSYERGRQWIAELKEET
jgi:hypothetical protein